MFFSAMDLGWKRAHHLIIILIFLKYAVADEGWFSQNVQPQQNWPVHKHFSLGGIQSSVLEAPVTRSIPVEEVTPNMVPGKSLNARKSRFSLSRQYVKGGSSSSYEPMSHTHSAPNVLDSTSLLKLLGSSSPSAQNVVRQDSYSWSPQDGSGLQGVSAQLASTLVRGGSSNSLSILSPSSSRSTPDSVKSLSPFDVSGLPTSDQSSSNMFTVSSQDCSGLQLGGASSQLSSTGSSGSSRRLSTATYQGSSGPQLAEGSSQIVSTSDLLTQPPSAESQNTSGSSYAKLVASPLGFSQATSGKGSYSQYTSSSQSRVGTQLAASHQYVPGQGSDYGLSVQPQGTTSQYAPAFSLGAKKMSSQYHQATLSGSLSPSQSSQGWQPSITKTQGFQGSSKSVSQGSGTSQSSIWSPSRFSSLQSQSTSSQNAPAPLGAKWPVYSQVAPSGLSLSPSQSSPWQTSSRWSQGFQTSGAVASQSSSPSQGFKAPSRLSTSAASLGQFASTQEGTARYSGMSIQSPSTSSQYSPESSGYTKLAASALGVGQSTSGHGSYSQLAGSSHYAPVQAGSTSTDGSSLGLQGTSGQYAPLNVKVYSQAAPSGLSLSPSQSSPWQTSSRWSQGFQTSGTVASQSSSPSQGSKAPSKFSTLTSAASPGHFASPQGSGKYSGLFSLSRGTSSPYSPGSSGYTKLVASPLGVSQSTSGHGSYSQLAGSSHYTPGKTGSTFTDGSSLHLQGTSTQYVPAALDAKVPVYSQTAPSGSLSLSQPSQWQPSSSWSKGFQISDTVASRSSHPSQGSKDPSRFSTSAVRPGQLASTQKESGRYGGLFSLSSASTQYSPGSPAYAKRGSSLLDVSSQSASGQSSYSQNTLSSQSRAGTQLAGSSHYAPGKTGSTFTDGSSLHLQGTSTQYVPAALDAKVPVYSQTAPSGSLSLSQPSQWQPSSSWSKGFQTSGTVASQSNSLSQGSKAPSKFSTLTSAASPGHFASPQEGSGKYSGLFRLSQGTSSPYSPGSSGYTKLVASPLGVSQSTSGHGSYSRYTSSSQSRAGAQLAGSSHYAPGQTGSTFTDGSSLHLQATSTQYVPAALDAKVPVYSQTAPSGSLSLSQPSQWQPSSSWSKGFQTSGTVASQSNSLSQGSKAPRKFSTLTSAASPGQFIATQEGSGRYSGLSSLPQGTSSQYSSGSPAYAKHGSSLEFSSQSTSDPSSSGLYSSSSQSRAGAQLAGSSSYVPARTGSTFTGAPFQFQGTSNQYAPSVSRKYTQASPSESSLTGSEAFRKWQPLASPWSKWFQASGTAVPQRSSSPQSAQTSSVSSFLPALSPSVGSVAQSSISSSRRNSVFGTVLGPFKLSAQAASGSAGSSQISPGLSASVHHLSGSTTSSLGSSVQGALQGTFSGQSSDSTSLISSTYGSTYGQKASGSSRPSQSSFATGLYSSSVKG